MILCARKDESVSSLSSVDFLRVIAARVHLFPCSGRSNPWKCSPISAQRSLIHCTSHCHGFLALASAGFVPLFAVHLATSVPFTCANVYSVHLAISTRLASSNQSCLWTFPASRRGDNCLFGHKLLQLDTNQTPGLSSRITLHLFKVVAITLPQWSSDLNGPGPTITAI